MPDQTGGGFGGSSAAARIGALNRHIAKYRTVPWRHGNLQLTLRSRGALHESGRCQARPRPQPFVKRGEGEGPHEHSERAAPRFAPLVALPSPRLLGADCGSREKPHGVDNPGDVARHHRERSEDVEGAGHEEDSLGPFAPSAPVEAEPVLEASLIGLGQQRQNRFQDLKTIPQGLGPFLVRVRTRHFKGSRARPSPRASFRRPTLRSGTGGRPREIPSAAPGPMRSQFEERIPRRAMRRSAEAAAIRIEGPLRTRRGLPRAGRARPRRGRESPETIVIALAGAPCSVSSRYWTSPGRWPRIGEKRIAIHRQRTDR